MKIFTQKNVAVVCLTPAGAAVSVARDRTSGVRLREFFPVVEPDAGPVTQFGQVLSWVKRETGARFADVRLYLSDFWLNHRLVALDRVPAKHHRQRELLRWRMAQEMDVPETSLAIAWQAPKGNASGGVYVTAMESDLRHQFSDMALREGCVLSHLGSLYHGLLAGESVAMDDGALGWLATDHWLTLRFRKGAVMAVRNQRGEGDEAVAALQRDLARTVTEQGVTGITLHTMRSRATVAESVAAAVAGTIPGVIVETRSLGKTPDPASHELKEMIVCLEKAS